MLTVKEADELVTCDDGVKDDLVGRDDEVLTVDVTDDKLVCGVDAVFDDLKG